MSNFERIFKALNDKQVRYITVGGVAVVLHGHLRTTADLDLVVDLDEANATAAIQALEALGFQPRAPVSARLFADAATRQMWIEDKDLKVFSLWHPEMPGFAVDLFVEMPFDFDAAHKRAVRISLDSCDTVVAAFEDLLMLKQVSGRPQDLADIQALNALHGNKEANESP